MGRGGRRTRGRLESCAAHLAVAAKGRERGKSPRDREWQNRPYLADEVIAYARTGGNVGVRLRREDIVLDLDPRNYPEGRDRAEYEDAVARAFGFRSFAAMIDAAPAVRTGSGGWHIYLRKPADVEVLDTHPDWKGVEFKSYGRQVVAAVRDNLPQRCVVDGEVVIASPHGLDFEALQQRIHPAASRVNKLAVETPASFVAFDLLAIGDEDLSERPFAERRERLLDVLKNAQPPVHITPATDDLPTAQRWFAEFEGAGLDGLIAKGRDLTYQPDKRVMTKIKHKRTADCVVAGYRVHKSGENRIGSLLLGLYDERDVLVSVGVIGSFPMAVREELYEQMQPLVTSFEGHPWDWAAHEQGERTPRKNETSREFWSLPACNPFGAELTFGGALIRENG